MEAECSEKEGNKGWTKERGEQSRGETLTLNFGEDSDWKF